MFLDITALNQKITQFTHSYAQTQQEIIALLKQIKLELTQIKQILKDK